MKDSEIYIIEDMEIKEKNQRKKEFDVQRINSVYNNEVEHQFHLYP